MNIEEFISRFSNHPILFVGTGMSLRYLNNSFTWDGLLQKISFELKNNDEFYLDIKSKHGSANKYNYDEIAKELEDEFNSCLEKDRNGKFKETNDIFYQNMQAGINVSRFKIYVSQLFKELDFKEEKSEEIIALKKVRKNIGSIITTNYDKLIENIFEFTPLIGNDILLSNPYGSVYKIHGCVDDPEKIIITSDDYSHFNKRYELIRAQLLSLFIHNPIIFMGYNIGDENIKNILKTIFTYVEPNTEQAEKIRSNFLLVEYDKDSTNSDVCEHDIDMEGFSTIRINKIKTDNYIQIYEALSKLQLPISAMDVRKVQSIVKEIYAGGNIKVNITEDLESLDNKDKVLVIGSEKTIKYDYQTTSEMIANYFNIIEEENKQLLYLIDKLNIQPAQYFPIHGFSLINPEIRKIQDLKTQQSEKLTEFIGNIKEHCKTNHSTIEDIMDDISISQTYKSAAIMYSILNKNVSLEDAEKFLKNRENKNDTEYRKMLCAYDYMRYN